MRHAGPSVLKSQTLFEADVSTSLKSSTISLPRSSLACLENPPALSAIYFGLEYVDARERGVRCKGGEYVSATSCLSSSTMSESQLI